MNKILFSSRWRSQNDDQARNFYPIATLLVKQFEAGELPLPDPKNTLSAFLNTDKKGIVEDNETGDNAYSFPEAYKAHMKGISKELKVKGKNLFHPLRLALTGETSGQDITKQLSLLSMVSNEGSPINQERAIEVTLENRFELLKTFCDTIPDEFRAPKIVEKNKGKNEKPPESKEAKVTTSAPASVDPLDTYEGPAITALDIIVGRLTKVWEHPDADKLYCEEIDVGEDSPRQVASGLRPYMSAEDMEGRLVLVLCNLKARKMLGFPSHGMVLCASNKDHSEVKLVSHPVDAKIGERVTVPGFNFDGEEAKPFAENKVGKKKIFEKLAPFLVTSEYGVPEFLDRPFMTSAGVCTIPIAWIMMASMSHRIQHFSRWLRGKSFS